LNTSRTRSRDILIFNTYGRQVGIVKGMATQPADRNAEAPVTSTLSLYETLLHETSNCFTPEDYEEIMIRLLQEFRFDEGSLELIKGIYDNYTDEQCCG